ncbi:hypothetical protein A2165_03125 [Candidatus Curtissbacteria bacterium RBG_13_40_7]|uniref:Uncharacterized protein n=1 Tax=Candidatus Curtissbacteria bacterium RBG_13_40_7 TaxID=1797706 RepID=A0A1F5FW21_9BACT|nr:MAG: hypothetical protein A2165_03125 [Candidatus Curtissbacteria bacterium RBG_13_40_7]
MGKEILVPIGNIVTPAQERLIVRSEGINPVEIFYEGELRRLKEEGYYLMYFCAPLRATDQKSVFRHSKEALRAAGRVLGAGFNGKDVVYFIPHLHVFPLCNELRNPELRNIAKGFNRLLLLGSYFNGLLKFGDQISQGMNDEIETAQDVGMQIVNYEDFIKLAGLPSPEQALDNFVYLDRIFNFQILSHDSISSFLMERKKLP